MFFGKNKTDRSQSGEVVQRSGSEIKKTSRLLRVFVFLLVLFLILTVIVVIYNRSANPATSPQVKINRDESRIMAISQLGEAMLKVHKTDNNTYLPEEGCNDGVGTNGFIDCLLLTGSLERDVESNLYTTQGVIPCLGTKGNSQNGYCYDAKTLAGEGPVVIYTTLEGLAYRSQCQASENAYYLWSSEGNKKGLVCLPQEPEFNTQNFIE